MMTQLSGNRMDKLLLGLEHWSGASCLLRLVIHGRAQYFLLGGAV
jgi:hypothetical protein